jgi:hypothetical protein
MHVAPAQFAGLYERLAPYKPERGADAEGACRNYVPDNDAAVVRWSDGKTVQTRFFDFSCLDDIAKNQSIRSAPELVLPGRSAAR